MSIEKSFCIKKFWNNLHLKDNIKPLDKTVYLSLVAIMKNESRYLKEWIEYHKLVGVERFYLYDNESDDATYEILKPYIQDGTVIYKFIKGNAKQTAAYADAVYHYKNETVWLALIDIDEYLLPIQNNTVSEILKGYEKYPALAVNWVMYDCNEHIEKPKGLTIENYTRVRKTPSHLDCHVKSIVNPRKVVDIINPHFCYFKNFGCAVCEDKKAYYNIFSKFIDRVFTPKHHSDKICINHYHCRSKSEYEQKIKTNTADNNIERIYNNDLLFFKEYRHETLIIDKYLEPLKKAMERKS